MLRRDEEAKDKLKELIENNAGMIPFIDEGKYSVSYGIITKNDINADILKRATVVSFKRKVYKTNMLQRSACV